MNNNNIKEKIKKLLALSADNPSDAESYAALQKAQELMAQYKIEQKDIMTEDQIKKCIHRKTTLTYGSRSSDHFLSELASIIAENFCCVDYISRVRGTQTNRVCFMGMEDDVEIAEEALHVANAAIIRGYNRVYREACKEYDTDYLPAMYFNPLKLGYIEGYMAGLKQVFEDQKEKNQEWGLVLVAPQEAKDFLSALDVREFNTIQRVDNSYYEEGYKDGKNFNLNKKIDDGKTTARIAE